MLLMPPMPRDTVVLGFSDDLALMVIGRDAEEIKPKSILQ